MTTKTGEFADLGPLNRAKEQKAWYWYDWANSAFYTTVLTVLFSPYLITVAGKAAGCPADDRTEDACRKTVSLLGFIPVAAGALPFFLVSFATIFSAFLLPIVGAMVDRSPRKKVHMAAFAWAGSFFCALLFFVKDENWQLGAVCIVLASILAGCSLISYSAILCDISSEEERDRVSSMGWAFGYLGGGLLLVVNLGMYLGHDALGIGEGMAVRLSMLSAAVWWAGFTIIPFLRLRNRPPVNVVPESGGLMHRSFGQLFATLKDLRNYPMTLTFLLAYVFYNDGIQTVIYAASTYGTKTLKFGDTVLIATILLIQFVAFGGALFFGRLAAKHGAYKSILWGLFVWMAIVVVAMFLPAKNRTAVPGGRHRDRRRARWHPGTVPVVLQPAHPPRPRGRVLRPLQRLRARYFVVRRAALRRGLPGHRLLPARHRVADHLLHPGDRLPAAARPGARDRRGRELGAGHPLDAPGRRTSLVRHQCQATLGETRGIRESSRAGYR